MAGQSGNQYVISHLVKGTSEFAKLFRAICQTVKEDHRAFRALSMGQENRKAHRVKFRPFGALHLLGTVAPARTRVPMDLESKSELSARQAASLEEDQDPFKGT